MDALSYACFSGFFCAESCAEAADRLSDTRVSGSWRHKNMAAPHLDSSSADSSSIAPVVDLVELPFSHTTAK